MKRLLQVPVVLPALFVFMLLGALRPLPDARGLDLEAFAALPVLHNGRIKPLDTLARNSLLILRGKQTLARDKDRMSAIEWLLDLSARLDKADAYKVFVIDDPDVLSLIGRRKTRDKYFSYADLAAGQEGAPSAHEVIHLQAMNASKIEPKARTRFQGAIVQLDNNLTLYQRLKYSLRINDEVRMMADLDDYAAAVAAGKASYRKHQASGLEGIDNEALGRLGLFFQRYRFLAGVAYFKPLPPAPGAAPDAWQNMGEGLLGSMRDGVIPPAVRSYAGILEAYGKGDTAGFFQFTARFRDDLALSAPEPLLRAKIETRFNSFEPFYQGLVLYLAAFLLICASWLYRPEALRTTAFRVLGLAFFVHTAGLLLRMWLQGRPPVTNLYSSAVFVGWGAVLLGIAIERMHRQGFGTLVSAAVGFCTLIIAHQLGMSGDTLEMMQAVLDSNFWLGTHVVVITIGYSSTFLASAFGIVSIFRRLSGRVDKAVTKSLTQMTYGIICFSLLFSFIGTILGGIWADQSWGRFWGWDPKENGALLIVLWHTIVLHARLGGHVRQRGLAVMAVFGGIICSLSWFGVNMLGIGLHSYGFMDKAFYGLSGFILSQLVVIGAAFLPPSSLGRFKWASAKGNKNTE